MLPCSHGNHWVFSNKFCQISVNIASSTIVHVLYFSLHSQFIIDLLVEQTHGTLVDSLSHPLQVLHGDFDSCERLIAQSCEGNSSS